MSDRFKFRAWDNVYKKFHYFHSVFNMPDPDYNFDNIEQCTGLKDKSGRLIFEGDFVASDETVLIDGDGDIDKGIVTRIDDNFKYSNGEIGRRVFGRDLYMVEWSNESCGFEPFSDSNANCGHCGGGLDPKRFEVLGNIHENPELFKEQVEK